MCVLPYKYPYAKGCGKAVTYHAIWEMLLAWVNMHLGLDVRNRANMHPRKQDLKITDIQTELSDVRRIYLPKNFAYVSPFVTPYARGSGLSCPYARGSGLWPIMPMRPTPKRKCAACFSP